MQARSLCLIPLLLIHCKGHHIGSRQDLTYATKVFVASVTRIMRKLAAAMTGASRESASLNRRLYVSSASSGHSKERRAARRSARLALIREEPEFNPLKRRC